MNHVHQPELDECDGFEDTYVCACGAVFTDKCAWLKGENPYKVPRIELLKEVEGGRNDSGS